MSVYLVVRILDVTNPSQYEAYRQVVAPMLKKYGGRYVVRGEQEAILEGEDDPKKYTLIEFSSESDLLKFWNSAEYAEAKKIRLGAGRLHVSYVREYQS